MKGGAPNRIEVMIHLQYIRHDIPYSLLTVVEQNWVSFTISFGFWMGKVFIMKVNLMKVYY